MSIRGAAAGDYRAVEDDFGTAEPFSLIDRHSSFDGTYRTDRDLRIEGEARGTISCQGTLFVAEGARVDATVDAENIMIAGELSGEIRCRGRLQLMPSGRMRGQVSTHALVINEGAIYEGQLEMSSMEPSRSTRGSEPVPINAASESRGAGQPTTFIRRMGGPETAWDAASAEAEPAPTDLPAAEE